MLNLSSVTLICVETRDPKLAEWAIARCLQGVQFARVILFTDLERIDTRQPGIEYVQAPVIKNTKDYSFFLLHGIEPYVQTSHALVIQWDSFITHPDLWREEFLEYDYIGPVWPHHPQTPVGNGGFSLRSKRLLQAIKLPGFVPKHPEDYCIVADNQAFLKGYGIQIAPKEIAEQFAVERTRWHEAFGFHGFFNFGRVLNDRELREFLKLLPEGALSGLDTFDLIAQLRDQRRIAIAKEIARKVKFRWKMRKRFIKLKFWLLLG
ncbi:hypothetical protein G6680_04610 [Polynucleobacter paneuropaeus]|uniref:DUF5672 family protein n=1 Tax=Polynucleobacter paneuropaeus TaxID=2527775 RepID=UPI000DBEFD28|nr:DUF5672 family protein [Polynucleobacter paneuropaeus]AWW43986.1 hypothetical protein DPM16_01325 [Polynucleobacter paneuropaeus]MBT8526707.1 hypothetical protein [Polynucleobacter paneuropaeus]MBT8533369.1 hypothetical protein [Polynucleobacter paneuropaeus]MBT8534514.1 hypothetical protein [Polynucleobacter paneuropaeus]MBT8545344.1 hypothetical protein [Polynucleobacter paneuropaeus]